MYYHVDKCTFTRTCWFWYIFLDVSIKIYSGCCALYQSQWRGQSRKLILAFKSNWSKIVAVRGGVGRGGGAGSYRRVRTFILTRIIQKMKDLWWPWLHPWTQPVPGEWCAAPHGVHPATCTLNNLPVYLLYRVGSSNFDKILENCYASCSFGLA
jgi:hypothetical protein